MHPFPSCMLASPHILAWTEHLNLTYRHFMFPVQNQNKERRYLKGGHVISSLFFSELKQVYSLQRIFHYCDAQFHNCTQGCIYCEKIADEKCIFIHQI